jgi:hypothetical protein
VVFKSHPLPFIYQWIEGSLEILQEGGERDLEAFSKGGFGRGSTLV